MAINLNSPISVCSPISLSPPFRPSLFPTTSQIFFPGRTPAEINAIGRGKYGRRIAGGRIRCGLLPVDPWSPTIDSQSVAPQLFAFSLFPYLGFLYFISKVKSAPKLTLFGFYFLLAFVGATIPAGIYAKVHYGTSLSNVDWLHGGAESLLTLSNLFVILGLREALKKSRDQLHLLYKLIDPISLNDIDESNEWLTERSEQDTENELVYEDEDLTWGQISSAAGVNEQRFNLRSCRARNAVQGGAGGSSSQTQRSGSVLEEEDEENDEGYKSVDGDDVDGDDMDVDQYLEMDEEDEDDFDH